MDSPPTMAVVIPSWNCLGDLRDCLESVRAQAAAQAELLVVDNGSADGTVAFLERERIPHLGLPENLGFARAVNLGVSRTRSPLVVVLNADTRLEPGCLERLAAGLEADPTLGGVQPMILQLEPGVRREPDDAGAVVYSLGQTLTADGRGREEAAGLPRGPSPSGAARSSASAARRACCDASYSSPSAATTSGTSRSARTST